jgi:hypothetical protein
MMDEQAPSNQSFTQQFGNVIDPSLARYFVDFEDVIDSLRMILSGMDVDYQEDPPVLVKFGDPMMNQVGIGKILAKLKMIHKGIAMSNFEKHVPYIFTRLQTYTIAKEVFVNMDEYGIRGTDDANKIIEMVMVALFSVYNRPVGEGERKFIKGYTRESHVITPQKGGRFSLT